MSTDACAFHDWSSIKEILDYMPEGWRQLALRPGERSGPASFRSMRMYTNPRPSKDPEVASAGAENAATKLIDDLLNSGICDRVVLGHDDCLLNTACGHDYAAQVSVRATNDWTLDRWLSRDNRLYGMALVSTSIPDAAAEEIRRIGKHDQIVAVALGAAMLEKTFGHPVYYPVYEAAVEMNLPLVIQASAANYSEHLLPPTAGGLPQTYAEYHAMTNQSVETHIARMVVRGVFERFPSLKVLVVGGGLASWPALLWKMDWAFKMARYEMTWLRRPPSEYFREHIRLSTYQIEHTTPPSRLQKALGLVPWFAELVVYASGYPAHDWARPEAAVELLPDDWRSAVLEGNGLDLFRWPGKARPEAAAASQTDQPLGLPGS